MLGDMQPRAATNLRIVGAEDQVASFCGFFLTALRSDGIVFAIEHLCPASVGVDQRRIDIAQPRSAIAERGA